MSQPSNVADLTNELEHFAPDLPVVVSEGNLLFHATIEAKETAIGRTFVIKRGNPVVW